MRILCFSINPIYPELITGGASKHLVRLVKYLAAKGHEVTILCAEDPAGQSPFQLVEGVTVEPVLRFHQPFPQPYAIAPGDLGIVYDTVSRYLSNSDRFYIHDGELLLPQGFTQVPIISSFRDNFYPESVLGSFLTQADDIISVSAYSASVITATAGLRLPGLKERIHIIPNGIDPAVFRPADSTAVMEKLGFTKNDWPILLHPHRPEEGKGLRATLRVASLLVHEFGFSRLKVLAPKWVESMEGFQEDKFYREVNKQIDEFGLRENVVFHPWLSQAEMAAYYSLGDVCLCLGSFVEAFGNVAYEAQACGTPAIVSKVGTHRTQLPDDLINKVDPGDDLGVAELSSKIFRQGTRVSSDARQKILSQFSLDSQLAQYEDIIVRCEKKPSLRFCPIRIEVSKAYKLAPWCYITQGKVYHDYKMRYITPNDIEGMDSVIKILAENGEIHISDIPTKVFQFCETESLLVPAD